MTKEELEKVLEPLPPKDRADVMDDINYLTKNGEYLLNRVQEYGNKLKGIREIIE